MHSKAQEPLHFPLHLFSLDAANAGGERARSQDNARNLRVPAELDSGSPEAYHAGVHSMVGIEMV